MLGRVFTYVYYQTGIFKLGLKRLTILCFVLVVTMCWGSWHLLKRIRIHRLRKVQIDEQMVG